MAVKNKIVDFEVIDHGYQHAQYFQGCGVSFTSFNHVVTGGGTTQNEAYSDALDQIAGSLYAPGGVDITRLVRHGNANYFRVRIPADVSKAFRENEECEINYLISIRYNLPAKLEAENEAAIKAFRESHNAHMVSCAQVDTTTGEPS